MSTIDDAIFDAAIGYVMRGWRIVPLYGVVENEDGSFTCGCKRPGCESQGKHPIQTGWQHATFDELSAGKFLTEHPGCNLGVKLGPDSGIIDFECDSPEEEQVMLDLFKGDIPATCCFKSGRGMHRLFKFEPGLPDKAVRQFGPLKVKIGHAQLGTQSVFPPSRHRSGGYYTWVLSESECAVQPLPRHVYSALCNFADGQLPGAHPSGAAAGYGDRRKANVEWKVIAAGVGEGFRNMTGAQVAGKILAGGKLHDPGWIALNYTTFCSWNMGNSPPLDDKELMAIWESILDMERRKQAALGTGLSYTIRTPQNTNQVPPTAPAKPQEPQGTDSSITGIPDPTPAAAENAPSAGSWESITGIPDPTPAAPGYPIRNALPESVAQNMEAIPPPPPPWRVVKVLSDPPEFKLFSPWWSGFLLLSGEEMAMPARMRTAAIIQKNVALENGFETVWTGRKGRMTAETDSRFGLSQTLMAHLTTELPPPERSRRCCIAQGLAEELAKAEQVGDGGIVRNSGVPQKLENSDVVFRFSTVSKQIHFGQERATKAEVSKILEEVGAERWRPPPGMGLRGEWFAITQKQLDALDVICVTVTPPEQRQ